LETWQSIALWLTELKNSNDLLVAYLNPLGNTTDLVIITE